MTIAEEMQAALEEAIPFLQIAIADYKSLEMFGRCLDALYLLSVIHHNLGMTPQRDEAAEQHRVMDRERQEMMRAEACEEWKEALDLVLAVGDIFDLQSPVAMIEDTLEI